MTAPTTDTFDKARLDDLRAALEISGWLTADESKEALDEIERAWGEIERLKDQSTAYWKLSCEQSAEIQRAAEEHNRRALLTPAEEAEIIASAPGQIGPGLTPIGRADMPPERIREMRERCERATPGPWIVRDEGREGIGIDQAGINNIGSDRFILNEGANGTRADLDFAAHAREDLPAALAEIERLQEIEGANILNRNALKWALEREEKLKKDMRQNERDMQAEIERLGVELDVRAAEIERLTAELAARGPADASLEARADHVARVYEMTACDWVSAVQATDESAGRDPVDVEARAVEAGNVYEMNLDKPSIETWLAVVRAVDASRPEPAIERTLNVNALARCARAALRIEVPDVAAWEALPEAERVGWRAVVRCILANTTPASRLGLTEEQAVDFRERAALIAETCSGGDHTISNRDLIARRIRELPLRASRGETGALPGGLTSIMADAQQRPSVPPAAAIERTTITHTVDLGCARPVHAGPEATCALCHPAPDPRATLHAGDPASLFAPGSLAAGSATEDRILDRKRGGK